MLEGIVTKLPTLTLAAVVGVLVPIIYLVVAVVCTVYFFASVPEVKVNPFAFTAVTMPKGLAITTGAGAVVFEVGGVNTPCDDEGVRTEYHAAATSNAITIRPATIILEVFI